ncbi:hypothetical protein BKP64_09595 [Marinobacter salinus]|uniref:Uncharacterized protein n=1 Tax=Marinobacter salinus TaxID=1874317 RepID=A0A1D9GL75_9GAMM|nr:hypothetical protein BKP64_09595 [Marinobacter salinus]
MSFDDRFSLLHLWKKLQYDMVLMTFDTGTRKRHGVRAHNCQMLSEVFIFGSRLFKLYTGQAIHPY